MAITVETVAGTTYTLVSGDSGKLKRFTSASSVTVTCPNTLPAGFECVISQAGAGQVTCIKGASATFINPYTISTRGQGSYVAIACETAGNFKFNGELSNSKVPLLHNYSAIAVPTATDDQTKGYSVGSRWMYSGTFYTCTSAGTGTATWYKEGGTGILPASTVTSIVDRTISAGDIGKRIELGSSAVANRTFTIDVSLLNSTTQISFVNLSPHRLEIVVSNTSTMYINSKRRRIHLNKGDGVLTLGGDTATNCNVLAGLPSYLLKAYCTISGGVLTIQSSKNCGTITRTSTGLYDIPFLNTQADTKYHVLASIDFDATPSTDRSFFHIEDRTTSNFTLRVKADGGAVYDADAFTILVVED